MDDWIGLVEGAYDLASDRDAWLAGLAARAVPLFDEGLGVTVVAVRLTPGRVAIEGVFTGGSGPTLDHVALAANRGGSDLALDRIYRGAAVGTLSERLADQPEDLDMLRRVSGGRVRDAFGVLATDGADRALMITSPLEHPRHMRRDERVRRQRAALHVSAAHRLRRKLASLSFEDPVVEAIFEPSGRLSDARETAQSVSARDRLRSAVRRSEAARGRVRHDDPDAALDLWQALVRGRWSLVDRFDTDGRRFVVAYRNEHAGDDPRGLTPRERDAAELLGRGHAPKEIAYALGIAVSTVEGAIARARAKLALRSSSELAAFFAPGGLRARLAECEISGEPLLVGSHPLVGLARLDELPAAERDVALLLVRGATNREIAARRGRSERTVANQVQAIFRTLGVHSRAELAALLMRGADNSVRR